MVQEEAKPTINMADIACSASHTASRSQTMARIAPRLETSTNVHLIDSNEKLVREKYISSLGEPNNDTQVQQ